MKTKISIILIAVLAMVITGCERRTLHDNYAGNLYVEVVPQLEDESATMPEVYAVAFYDPDTHTLVQTSYIYGTGGFVHIETGCYDMLVYNFDTDYTQLRKQSSLSTIEAFTSEVTTDVEGHLSKMAMLFSQAKNEDTRSYADAPIVYEPDHLYAYLVQNLTVPMSVGDDDVLRVVVYPSTILERYTISIGPVFNAQYVSGSEVFLTGVASAKLVNSREVSEGPATLWFPISLNAAGERLETVFYTFGKYPGTVNEVYLMVSLTDTSGNEYDGEWDVTDQIDSGSHDIIINCELDIPTPDPDAGGGMAPSVTTWDNNEINIQI
ncbi:MAG: DUF5119 domain-containing protein [Bacteroidales bacterium]|nr:DUF5119 domain-containing protein [Bacteroidales bacterium]